MQHSIQSSAIMVDNSCFYCIIFYERIVRDGLVGLLGWDDEAWRLLEEQSNYQGGGMYIHRSVSV